MNEFLVGLAHANVAAAAAILLVLVLRKPVRRLFGARIGYALWCAPPAAALASLLPGLPAAATPPIVNLAAAPVRMAVAWASQGEREPDRMGLVFAVWALGAAASLCVVFLKQQRFLKLARGGLGGPAVVGVFFPKVVVPADFEARFTDDERGVILAHERMHLARNDARVTGLIALAQCLCWFNPLVHVAAFHARLDQELACDAEIMARFPKARRTYAEAMLKTQLASAPLPLGCYWPPRSIHPLEARIAMLNLPLPGTKRRIVGAGLAVALMFGAGYAAWAAEAHRLDLGDISAGATLGDAHAKVTVIEYASTTCPHCARWNAEVFPAFKKKYIDSGQVRYVFREFPTAPTEVAAAGFLIARCAAPDRYFEAIDALFRSQGEMFASGDAKPMLLKVGRSAGMSDDQTLACIQDETAIKALNGRVEKAMTVDKIEATPTFVIGDKRLTGEQPLAAFDAVLQPMLAAK